MNILEKYLDDFESDLISDNYADDYLENICKSEYTEKNIELLKNYNLTFIGDILYYNLDILEVPTDTLEKRIKVLINELGTDYVNIINNDIELLDTLI